MKILLTVLLAVTLVGCAGTHPRGIARYDHYDSVKVEQMTGNNVSPTVFAKTILCLNARRESRVITALTNTVVTAATNATVVAITNQTISFATNILYSTMTNLAPATPPPPSALAGDATGIGGEANTAIIVAPSGPALSTNLTASVSSSVSGTSAPNQRTANLQTVRTFNNQFTTTSNNLSIVLMTNIVVTGETNSVINYSTNTTVVAVTNSVIIPTNGVSYDYFLVTELLPPPDFTPLAQGETLVLLVDGVRHGFTPGQSGTSFVARKGYTSALYRVPPEVLVDIANAKEVSVRLRGVNNAVERDISNGCRRNFREFLARYFVPDPALAESGNPIASAAIQEIARTAQR